MITLKWVSSEEDMKQAYEIRYRVFVEEQHVPAELERDEADERAHHLIAFIDGTAAGTGRIIVTSPGKGKIGRIAVLKGARGCHVGSALMEEFRKWASMEGLQELYLDAQLQVISFYQKLGYAAEGEIFPDAGILHRRMRLRTG